VDPALASQLVEKNPRGDVEQDRVRGLIHLVQSYLEA
jgi:hypothetical protein